ncbi:MAG: hypothetical protein H6696_18540 [Deferribacteres bacterium]|nr:hypothetical protein [candidate division KSB1 bacterium]MCB9503926.1 hypothetical protein [Deferribacteres bacterium]
MELIGLFVLFFFAWIALKIIAVLLNVTIFAIALPFKILGLVFACLFFCIFALPLGLFAGLAGLLITPFIILLQFLPLLLIGFGIYLLVKNA